MMVALYIEVRPMLSVVYAAKEYLIKGAVNV